MPATEAVEVTQGDARLRVALYPDGVIVCCSIDRDEQRCCFTSKPDHAQDYAPLLERFRSDGYEIAPLPEGAPAPRPHDCPDCRRKFMEKMAAV